MYSTAPADWVTGHWLERQVPLFRDATVYSTAPVDWSHRTLVGEGSTLFEKCRQCILQPQLTRPQDTCWGGGGLTPFQTCSQCILQPQLTGPQDTCLGGGCLFLEIQSVYSTAPADWATGHLLGEGLTPFQKCSPSQLG